MNQQILNGLKALADGKAVGYHRLDGVTVRITSAGLFVDHLDVWREGEPAPTYQGRVEPDGPGLWRAMTANGKPHNKTDVLRQHSTGLDYPSALAVLVSHRSQRPAKAPWDELAAARAARVARVAGDATGSCEALILLPHSGVRVPHTRLAVTSLKQVQMSRGVAYTATLRLDGRIVGTVENEGCGGETMFQSRPGAGFGYADLDTYAAQCRTVGGATSTESVLNALVDEFDTARLVAKAAKAGRITCRLLSRISVDSPVIYATDHATLKAERAPRTPAEKAELGRNCHQMTPAQPGQSRWQVWDADAAQWIDLPSS